MSMAYGLALRRPKEAREILERQLEALKDPERTREFQFVSGSMNPSEEARDRFFSELKLVGNRKSEPWVVEALSYLHHPLQGAGSERYVRPSLELVSEIKRTSGIFFPLNWLNATLRPHVNQSTRAVVDDFLKNRADLDPGLRLKLLQAADPVFRFTQEN